MNSFAASKDNATLTIKHPISDIKCRVYKVAEYSETGAYALEKPFDRFVNEVELLDKIERAPEDMTTNEWRVLGITLNTYLNEPYAYEKLEGVIKKRKVVILDSLEDGLNDINKRLEDIDLSLKVINNKISNNKKIFVSLKDVFEKIDKLEKEVMVYKDLSDTANGTISGKNKFEFEQYVQASYFDQVLVAANKRFLYMTDERYLLKRKEESVKISDKLGLELEVMDYYTGKVRDIKSLSGGESFKASLALALGMSDTIQEFAGGVVVDAMFIDEGFGSLDDDSLDQAMNAIMVLGEENRLIGIISHVNELKSRIDKKIVVNKTNQGSSIKIVI